MPSMDTLVEALACPSDMSGSTQGLAVNVDMIVCVFSLCGLVECVLINTRMMIIIMLQGVPVVCDCYSGR